MFAGKKSAQLREILISESAWEEMTCLFAPSLDFSPRLKKLAGVPCQVYVRTVAANNAQPLTQDQCLRALHHLRVQSTSKTAPQAK